MPRGLSFPKKFQKTCAPSAPLVTQIRCAHRCGQPETNHPMTRRPLHSPADVHSRAKSPAQVIHSSFTTPDMARAAPTRIHPQHAQALLLLLIYLLGFLFEEGGWGNTKRSALATRQRPSMSPRSISFQVEPESSTVIQRQPLRSSQRIVETRGEIPGNRWLALLCGLIEGTLWTWRRQLLA